MKLIDRYEKLRNEIINEFSRKQDLSFDGWIADEIGGTASFCHQYFFNISDIVLDLKAKKKSGFILNWQSESVDHNKDSKENYYYINYSSWIKGERY